MDRALLTLLVIVTAVIIFGLILMIPPASGALTQQELHLFTKIYDKLTYMLWEEKHQSALQVRNELIQQDILETNYSGLGYLNAILLEEQKQTKLLDHLDCILTNEMMHGGVDNPKRTLPIDCNDGFPLNVTGVWNPGYWERNPEGS